MNRKTDPTITNDLFVSLEKKKKGVEKIETGSDRPGGLVDTTVNKPLKGLWHDKFIPCVRIPRSVR